MKKAVVVLILSICVTGVDSYAAVFSDDFESGTLSQWTIEGRRAGRASTASIVSRDGSRMAHLYQDGFTEVTMSKTFDYQTDLHFSFDMENQTYSQAPIPNSEFYASAGVSFYFLDAASNELGYVRYGSNTSTWPAGIQNPYPNKQVFHTYGPLAAVYSLDVETILSNITIDQNAVAYVQMQFAAYTSGDNYTMSAHTWVDNVMITPEPATLLLLGLGAIVLRRKK